MADSDELDYDATTGDGGAVLAPERTSEDDRPVEPGEPAELEPETGPTGPTWVQRGARRLFRRPVAWAARPWPTERIIQVAVTAFSLVLTTVIMMNVTHLNPLNPGA